MSQLCPFVTGRQHALNIYVLQAVKLCNGRHALSFKASECDYLPH